MILTLNINYVETSVNSITQHRLAISENALNMRKRKHIHPWYEPEKNKTRTRVIIVSLLSNFVCLSALLISSLKRFSWSS